VIYIFYKAFKIRYYILYGDKLREILRLNIKGLILFIYILNKNTKNKDKMKKTY